MSNYWSRIFLTVIIGIGVTTCSFAQPKTNSPYSRIGLGDLVDQNFAAVRGLGGTAAAYHDPYHVNVLNPASLTYLGATSFEIGLDAKTSYLKNSTEEIQNWSGNISYFSLGFPTKNPINRAVNPIKSPFHWAMNFSLIPYSLVGYDVQTEDVISGVDTVQYNYEGSGGTYKVMWGNGVRYNNIAFGVNLGYMFGKISNVNEVHFPDIEQSYFTYLENEFSVRGFVWNVGAQYDHVFKKLNDKGELVPDGRRLTFGVYGNSKNTMRITASNLDLVREGTSDFFLTVDTLNANSNEELKGTLPSEFGIGIAYTKQNKWRLGVDYSVSNWSQYRNEAKPESLVNSWRLAVGGGITPDARSYNNYFKKITYNFGLFYSKDPRGSVRGDLINYGATAGIVMPVVMKNQASSVNITFELGRLGIEEGLRELYGKFTVGFTLNNNEWFLKRKFY